MKFINNSKINNFKDIFLVGTEFFCNIFNYIPHQKFFMTNLPINSNIQNIFSENKYLYSLSKNYFISNFSHDNEYLINLQKILYTGKLQQNRTGTSAISLFGQINMCFDLRKGFPLLTTKYLNFQTILKELLFFISGKTDTSILERQNVTIWSDNTSFEFIKNRGLSYSEKDMGPGYPFQWRHYSAEYKGCKSDYTGQGVDQLQELIHSLKTDPMSRRHILCSWNPSQNSQMVLPPCHCLFQCNVEDDYLDGILYQRSGDFFLGIPFNIASYSTLLMILGKLTNLKPRYFYHFVADAHIYENHISGCKIQLSRTPIRSPILKIKDIRDIDSIDLDDFSLDGYISHRFIRGRMAI